MLEGFRWFRLYCVGSNPVGPFLCFLAVYNPRCPLFVSQGQDEKSIESSDLEGQDHLIQPSSRLPTFIQVGFEYLQGCRVCSLSEPLLQCLIS